jgi:hypothetical protein
MRALVRCDAPVDPFDRWHLSSLEKGGHRVLIAIDPGVRCSAYAVLNRSGLLACGYDVRTLSRVWHERLTTVVCELPQVYGLAKPPNDLVELAFAGGFACGTFSGLEIKTVKPTTWKGQIPKHICHARVIAELNEYEVRVLDSVYPVAKIKSNIAKAMNGGSYSSKIHNVLDAIGIGKWQMKQLY